MNITKARLKKKFIEYKKTLKCQRCPESHWSCLVFHHRDPSQKSWEVTKMVTNCMSWNRILFEIAKCDVLCANCHLKLHAAEHDETRFDNLPEKRTKKEIGEMMRKRWADPNDPIQSTRGKNHSPEHMLMMTELRKKYKNLR